MSASDQAPSSLRPEEGEGYRHYLRAVSDMASRRIVTTQQAIHNDRGVKLLEKGVRVDGQLYDRLMRHRLRGPIDAQLRVQGMESVQSTLQAAALQCRQDRLVRMLVDAGGGEAERLLAPVRALTLPQPLAFKLTVMREQRPELHAHSVRVMLAAIHLGLAAGLEGRACSHLAAAGLLHDIGVLHMDPIWRDPETRVSGPERKHLLAHPITAMMLIQAQEIYPSSVAQAVLEHHECMDGSGYPRGLQGERISTMGQALLLAEVVVGFFEKYADEAPAQRLSLSLRLNHRKYPAALVGALLPALHTDAQAGPGVEADGVQAIIALLSHAFDDWEARSARLALAPRSAWSPARSFVTERLAQLQKALLEAGSHPRQQAGMLAHLMDDPQSLAELFLLGREALWQLQSIIETSRSRWPELEHSAAADDRAVVHWRQGCEGRLAQEAPGSF